VLGKTGSGKSYFLASLFLALWHAGLPVTLLDPHGDLARVVLSQLTAAGQLTTEEQRQRLIYLDLPRAQAANRFLPFNYLDQPYDDHAMAEHVAEACRRAWPELAHGAPTFENILKHAVIALRQNDLPLTALADLLTDRQWRDTLLMEVTDPQVVRFFHARVDQWGRDEATMKESTLNRADLLTLSPVLRYALGNKRNVLRFRSILDSGTSVIINLAIPSPDTRRLLGCLLTVGMEAAALSRADASTETRRITHHLILDEFSQFMAQSEESLTRMLSETRKYGLFCVMAHQNWSQASDRLKGALQNVGLEIILKAGRPDAEYSARLFGSVDPDKVKHTVEDEAAEERTHPTYYPLVEQWERQVQAIQRLQVGQAFVRLPSDHVQRVRIPRLPPIIPSRQLLADVDAYYLDRYFESPPMQDTDRRVSALPAGLKPAAISRRPAERRIRPDG
jgi:Type IV secretion-system coupling protein DNA-binding domain